MFYKKLKYKIVLSPIILLFSMIFTNSEVNNHSTTNILEKTPNKHIDIKKVMDYPLENVLNRYCRDYKVSLETAKIYERELKRYFILAADDDESNLAMMSTHVDNLWHTFLLFTKDYQVFCNEMFGKFIHHTPVV